MISTTEQYNDRQVSQAALKVSMGGLLSLVLGLGVQVVTAYLFGAGEEMDAFFTASIIPVYIQLVLLTGLPFVVIPAFVREEVSGRKSEAWGLAGSFFYLTTGILIIISIIAALFSSKIISLVAPGFGVGKAELAARMLAIMMFTLPFVGMGYISGGIENARNRFFGPAAAVAVGSAANLIVLLTLHSWNGSISLAWGTLAASILQTMVTTVPFLKYGWKSLLPLDDPRIIELIRLIAPFIFFGIFSSSRSIIERFYASQLPTGQISYIGYGYKVASIFVVLLASSIASAIFPAMAREYSLVGKAGLFKRTDYGLRLTFAVALPALVLTSVCAVPFVSILYERGAFEHFMTLNVALIIPFLMINEVLFRMVNNLLSRVFYILKDTFWVNLIQSVTIIFYIWAAYLLTAKWGYVGLVAAQVVQAGPTILLLGWVLYWRTKSSPTLVFFQKISLYTTASLIAGLISWITLSILSNFPDFIILFSSLAAGGLIYLTILKFVDTEISNAILEMSGVIKIIKILKPK